MRGFFSSNWNKITAGAVLASAILFGAVTAYKYMNDDCCGAQQSCCHTGSPCCANHRAQAN